ncbi:hypothetical protein B0A55_01097 [Friedmanniomyces simplex]|uniref:REJ domain-containing protein n=1 Tax=Friedmanniomyces simplex TaxID=329884 RepID=A0A4U0XXN9_9PEZI|nr:hypothetical protein B0A55_01097 [Friedmanniomyces simplex]
MQAHHPAHSSDQIPGRRAGHAVPVGIASRSASFDRRTRSDDSWVEISSQPSSSSLSSVNDDIVPTGLRVQHDPRARRRRALRPGAPSHLNITHRPSSVGGTSSQEEYEESESESDRVMTSSGEGGLLLPGHTIFHADLSPAVRSTASEDSAPLTVADEDENRTAINYPINNDACFTPQPNAFSHPPSSGQPRHVSAPVPGSYFPATRAPTRSAARQSLSAQPDQQSHMPQNILSPSYNAAAQHDEALRTSLSTLLSCAAAARGLPKTTSHKRGQAPTTTTTTPPARSNRIAPLSFRLIPESAVPIINSPPQSHEPTFHPTLRRSRRRPSTSTSASAASDRFSTNNNNNNNNKETKRKAPPAPPAIRSSSRERRALKKARRASSSEELYSQQQGGVITPTLLTWVVSAGVVVVLSALSFGAGYSLGREAGRFEAGGGGIGGGVGGGGTGGGRVGLVAEADEQLRGCAREAARSGLGLKRGLLGRSAVQV